MKSNPLIVPALCVSGALLLLLFSVIINDYGLFLVLGVMLQAVLCVYTIAHFRGR